MRQFLNRFVRDEQGQDLVEYAFLVGLIGLVAFVGVRTLGQTVNTYYATTITSAPPFTS